MMETRLRAFNLKTLFDELKDKIDEYRRKLPFFLNKLNLHSALAIAGIIGPLLLTIGDLTAALTAPGYNLVKDSISSLALTGIGWLQTIGFLALGLHVEIFTTGLMFSVHRRKWFHLGIGIFVFFGFAMLLIGAFHTDPLGAARTTEGRIHGLMATTAFTLFPIAILCLLPSLRMYNNWKELYRYSKVTFYVAVGFLVLTRVFQDTSGWFGLGERLLVANIVIWVEVMAVRLFILSLRRGDRHAFNFFSLP
jgi:hypothetical protein